MYCGIIVEGPRKGEFVQTGHATIMYETVPRPDIFDVDAKKDTSLAAVQKHEMKLHIYDVQGGIKSGIWVPVHWTVAECVGYLNKAVYAFTQSELVDVATR